MSTVVNTQLPKICHARIGQQVRLTDRNSGDVLPEIFVVVAFEEPARRPARAGMSQGLYDDERQLMLVSLTTGIARKMPHLSSRAELLRSDDLNAALTGKKVPLLVPEDPRSGQDKPQAWHQVELALLGGQRLNHAADLADTKDVLGLLDRLQHTGARVIGVSEASERPAEALLELWRHDVAAGLTQLSLQDYMDQML